MTQPGNGGPPVEGSLAAAREIDVLDAITTLVDSLLNDFDQIDLLTDLVERCVLVLDIASAGLLLGDERRQLHLMAATSERTRDLELFQLQADEGPCLDCYRSGRRVSVADLNAEQPRWPQFVDAATEAGFVSVHAVPMRAAGIVLGALGLFGTGPGDLAGADLAVAQTLAHVATVAIVQEHAPTPDTVLPRLRVALINRVFVEQAKGFLRQRLDVSIDEAFALLRRYARAEHRRLSELARSLVHDRGARDAIVRGITSMTAGDGPGPARR